MTKKIKILFLAAWAGLANELRSLLVTKKIKILFLAASPRDVGELRLGNEVSEIEEQLLRATNGDRFELIQKWAVTPEALREALLRHKPHIVHFSGHGNKTLGIVLEDKSGDPLPVSKPVLIELFNILKDNIHIVFLNACYAACQAEDLAEIIDYTIGVQTEIHDDDAILFAASFYQSLAYGRSVKEAFDLANNRLKTQRVSKSKRPKLLVRKGVDTAIPFLDVIYPPPSQDSKKKETRKMIAQIIGVIILISSPVLIWLLRGPEDSNQNFIPAPIIIDPARAELYAKAVEQLKNPSLLSRIDAIDTLNKLSSDPDYYDRAIRLLAIFIKENSKLNKNVNVQQSGEIPRDIQKALGVIGWRKHKWQDGEALRLDLSDTYLQEADLKSGSESEGAHLEGAELINANLEQAMLRYVNLSDALLRNANLKNATLYKANLQNADLRGADLEGADLQWVIGLTVEQVKEAKNWNKAVYSQAFENELLASK